VLFLYLENILIPLSQTYILSREVYNILLALILVLADATKISNPDFYCNKEDFLHQAPFDIITAAANLSKEAATYL
jgi:hypothetical protein